MTVSCSNPQCQIAETGICLDGFSDVTECPNYGSEPTTEVTEDSDSGFEPSASESEDVNVHFFEGQSKLSPKGADSLLKKNGGRIVACVGPTNVGKTTLFASMYDLLQIGPIANWNFGCSETVYPFEELCHLARSTSKRHKADTPRTSALEGLNFYHLALRNNETPRVDLFLADRAGEYYNSAADNSEACSELFEVSRADVILLLVDAESLGNNATKHLTKRQALRMIEAFADANMLEKTAKIIITLTRFDLAQENGTEKIACTEHAKIIESATQILGPTPEVIGKIVAARPESLKSSQPGEGIADLLDAIIHSFQPKTPVFVDASRAIPSRTFLDPEFSL
jgi:hypothetical protein